MSSPETVDPSNPEPSPDATVRLPVGAPVDPYSTQRLDLSKQLAAASTQKLPLGAPEPASNETQKLVISRPDEPPIRRQKVDPPVETEGQTQNGPLQPEAGRPFGWKLPAALGLLLVVGVATILVFSKRTTPPRSQPAAAVAATESVPPSVQLYLEQAKAGDTHAMRTLGAYYYNGLNVPQDREKGLYWYRKAAEKGSDAARAELNQIEGGH
jgi:TPR repeat protein